MLWTTRSKNATCHDRPCFLNEYAHDSATTYMLYYSPVWSLHVAVTSFI
jgi:hypothetical protein